MNITIHELSNEEITLALALTWEVFMEFEAPDYSQEGIDEFKSFINNWDEIKKLRYFGAFEQDCMLGILAMRQEHVTLLFVRKEFHRKGVAKSLFMHLLEQTKSNRITVNSSPYAVEIYRKLGFTATDSEQTTNGIRYTPMVYTKLDPFSGQ